MKKKSDKKIALVLGGGSARGIAHIGVLKVLKYHNIPIDFVVGTSIGSLMGAVYALDIPLAKVEKIALKTNWWNLTDFVISRMGFLEGMNLEKLIREITENKGFEDLKIPLAIVTNDIENGEEIVFTTGNLRKVIRASCSVPGVFIPVRLGGKLLVDGGLKSSVSSEVARRMGADFIIAVDVGFCIRKGRISNIFQVLFQSIQIIGNELNKHQSKQADEVIKVHLSDDIDQMAFHKAAEIILAGERAVEEAIGPLLSHMKEEGLV
ncbi:MAG: patatin-like phospholipase family protein [Candidatus Omnitrophota bacterium]